MSLSMSCIVVGEDAVVSVSGEVDLATIPLLHDALAKALARHPGRLLVIDLDGVTVLDDTGLGVLLGAAGSARQTGADLAVVCNNVRLRERLDRTGFSRAVEVRDRWGAPHMAGGGGGGANDVGAGGCDADESIAPSPNFG